VTTTITAQVPLLGGTYEIAIENERIAALTASDALTELYAGPTLFDIQVNGYGGRTCRIPAPEKEDALAYIARLLRERGIGWWMPTITTASADDLLMAFQCCGRALDADADTAASIPGLHLEGPYISKVDGPRGAHGLEHVRPPDWDEVQRLQEACGGRIKLLTLAPEVEGAVPFIKKCIAAGIVVAMGHTDLDRQSLARAVDAGATLSTHLGNGAHDQVQRHNNYLWYQLAEERTYASFIADNQHLPQECLYSMLRAKSFERSVLVSDSVLLGGMKPGLYHVRGRDIEMLESGRIVIPGTPNLAGSGSNLLECVEFVTTLGKVEHARAWAMASLNPANLMGMDDRLGIEVGKEASLTLYQLGGDGVGVEVAETWVAGRKVFDAACDERVVMPERPLDAAAPI